MENGKKIDHFEAEVPPPKGECVRVREEIRNSECESREKIEISHSQNDRILGHTIKERFEICFFVTIIKFRSFHGVERTYAKLCFSGLLMIIVEQC